LGKKIVSIGEKISQTQGSQQRIAFEAWRKINGDKTLRLNYDLSENSIVFDLGGYEGQWSSDIYSMYCCSINIFEPVPEFADNIIKRFSRNRKIHVYDFGLASQTRNALISVCDNSSSIFRPFTDANFLSVPLIRASDYLNEEGIARIDLMKINIEGAEYDLLEHLIDTGWVQRIDNIQIQFHSFAPDAHKRMYEIQERLELFHQLTYQYLFVWENWKLK
jgi:FkbM family methyltransferase